MATTAPVSAIAGLLLADGLIPSLPAFSRDAALRALARHAEPQIGVPAGLIAGALRTREALGATGFGGGVAIPHARLAGLAKREDLSRYVL